ncbi:MAG: helix-turn-helix domain-containing protein [Phycisphaera sp.]|nr:MAG: helix-turn-helix domain-containing protein [Phycisphaera sp.]
MTNKSYKAEQEFDFLIGQRLIQARELLDLDQHQVASMLDITTDQLDGHETGMDPMTAGRMVRLAEALRIKPEMLVAGLIPHAGAHPSRTSRAFPNS